MNKILHDGGIIDSGAQLLQKKILFAQSKGKKTIKHCKITIYFLPILFTIL
jgi:hypothetical protein